MILQAVLFMFALAFVQGCAHFLRTEDVPPELLESIKAHWGSIGDTMLVLMQSVTGGVNWATVAEPLKQVGAGYYMLFCFYIIFFLCCVLNTITGLFVETTLQKAAHDTQWTIQHELEKKAEYSESLRALFAEMDKDNDGLVTVAEFCSHLSDPILVAFASSLGIDMADAALFFSLCSSDGTGSVDLDTFVTGCIRLKGHPLTIDVQQILVKQKDCQQQLGEFIDWSERCMVKLESLLVHVGHDPKCVEGQAAEKMSCADYGHKNQDFSAWPHNAVQGQTVAVEL